MDQARPALGPSSPTAAVRPDGLGIDDGLESALLAGLADEPEGSDGDAFEADSDASGPPAGTAGLRTAAPDTGTFAAAPAPPADPAEPDAEPDFDREPRVGLPGVDLPDPTPEAPLNGALVRSPDLEGAPGGAVAEPPSPASGGRGAAVSGGGGEPEGPVEATAAGAATGDRHPFSGEIGKVGEVGETGAESPVRSEWTFGEEPAEHSLMPIAARDEPAPRPGSIGPRDGLPAGFPGDGLADDEPDAFAPAAASEPQAQEERAAGFPPAPDADWSSPAVAADPDLERTLRDGLDEHSAGDPPPEFPAASAPRGEPGSGNASPRVPDSLPSAPAPDLLAFDGEPDPDASLAPRSLEAPGAPAEEPAPFSAAADLEAGAAPLEDVPAASAAAGEPAVLAFATDPESESALREGLAEHPNPQVWPGGLGSAIMTLGAGPSSPLLFVDLDETAYPAGAIHELAAVCEVGTVVIAFGSDGTARFSREVLLAGVSDYLVKPIGAAAVREAAARATASARSDAAEDPVGGWSVGFAGTGGSGATTLAAAAALLAAERGRYVSVLDLNRTFPTLSFLLDVEPAPGLVDLLSTVARASLHPEVVDGMRAERSDRVAVYGYPWSAAPPPCPPVWAICELLVELQRRSHLVIVDGLDDPATRISLLAMVDARVLVVEPTATGAAAAARTLSRFAPMFDADWPLLLVQNHTRPLKPRTGARILRDAGVEATPEVVVPFEPALPALADRGWPEGRLPRSLRRSFATLADRILAAPAAAPAPA